MKHVSKSALLAGGAAVVAMPRAIAGSRIKADATDPKIVLAQIQEAFAAFKTKNEEDLKAKVSDTVLTEHVGRIDATLVDLEKTLDAINAKVASNALNGGQKERTPEDIEYGNKFLAYVRDGMNEGELKAAHRAGGPKAAMTEGSNADGGYTTPIEWDRTIEGRLKLISPMRQNAKVQSISTAGFTKLFTDRAVGSGWVGETASRPATSTPTFTALSFGVGEIYANPAASQTLLDDSEINIEQWLAGEVETEFERQESIAFLSGDGVNKPYGLLTYLTGAANAARHPWGDIKVVASGSATTFTSDPIVDLMYALPAAYAPGAKFFSNRSSLAAIRKLKDGQGNYLWNPTFTAGQPSTLGGYPLIDMPDMPTVGAGNVALLFGDMARTYLIIDRIGVRVLRDPYSNKPYVSFYTTKRVGGGVQNPDAMKAMKIAAS